MMNGKLCKKMRKMAKIMHGDDWRPAYRKFKKSPGDFYGQAVAGQCKDHRSGASDHAMRLRGIEAEIMRSRAAYR